MHSDCKCELCESILFYFSKFLIVVFYFFLYFYVATVSAISALLSCGSFTFYFTYSFTMQIND